MNVTTMIPDLSTSKPNSSFEVKTPLSEACAVDATHQQARSELALFTEALALPVSMSTDKVALLLEHVIKEQTSSDSSLIRDQMIRDGWEKEGIDATLIETIAQRASAYLATDKGIKLFNFFVKTYARTSPKMFEDEWWVDK
jgi:hypothetical protein